jgi:hypothetical protein
MTKAYLKSTLSNIFLLELELWDDWPELLQENLRLHEVLLITAAMSSKLPVRSPGYPRLSRLYRPQVIRHD